MFIPFKLTTEVTEVWEVTEAVFQGLEKFIDIFPSLGKTLRTSALPLCPLW
jgi:hypothetical protein